MSPTPAGPSAAAPSPKASAPNVPSPISADAVADVVRILPGWLESVRTARSLTGVQVAIWHEGEIATHLAVGDADASAGIPLRTTHRLRIASHSKMVTAMMLIALQDQGRLRLDDTVGSHVAELADAPAGTLTLRDLLSHSAGITRDARDSRWWQLQRPFAGRDELLAIGRSEQTLLAEPGLHLQYSNIGYGFLGLVIEAVTGRSFAQAAQELVLDPLGLTDIGPDLPADAQGPEDPHGFAVGHTARVLGPRRTVEQFGTGALAPATGFWATAAAIAELAGRTLCDGEVIGHAGSRTLRRRVWTLSEGRHYGLGLQEGEFHGSAAAGHSGGFPTGLSRTWAVPASRLAISVIGTAVDAPVSEIAVGILGLLALADGRPAPQAASAEGPTAGGGAGIGRPRPDALSTQAEVEIGSTSRSAREIAEALEGTYDDLWGRTRCAVLGGRLFALDDSALDPAQGATELCVDGVRPDPMSGGARSREGDEVVVLRTWGDVGYGSHLEPMLARVAEDEGALRCTGIIDTGQLALPTGSVALPSRITLPA